MHAEGSHALIDRLHHAERAARGLDPDGTAYLDLADRLEQVRAAYRARLLEEERGAGTTNDTRGRGMVTAAELI
jgi:hypothetical protein